MRYDPDNYYKFVKTIMSWNSQYDSKREYLYILEDWHFKALCPFMFKFHYVLCHVFIIIHPGRIPFCVIELALLYMLKIVKAITYRHQVSNSNTPLHIVEFPCTYVHNLAAMS